MKAKANFQTEHDKSSPFCPGNLMITDSHRQIVAGGILTEKWAGLLCLLSDILNEPRQSARNRRFFRMRLNSRDIFH